MTDGHNTMNAANDSTSAEHASDYERAETFSPTGPVRATIYTKSGDIRVRTVEGEQLDVTLRASSSKSAELLSPAVVRFDVATSRLTIESQPRVLSGSFRDLRGAARSWFDFGSADLDVVVDLPHGSSVEIKTLSGDARLEGTFADIDAANGSGDVSVFDTCESLEVKTASGDVRTGDVLDVLKCYSASGNTHCLGTATKTDIASASGNVDLTAGRSGDVSVKVVSGDVVVRVAPGLVVDVNANTVSGELGTNIDFGAADDPTSDEAVLGVKVSTVSGDIRVEKTATSNA